MNLIKHRSKFHHSTDLLHDTRITATSETPIPSRLKCRPLRCLRSSSTAVLLAAAMLVAGPPAHSQSASPGPVTVQWEDSFGKAVTGSSQPNPANWTFEEGGDGWGNAELETYCAYGSNKPPCDSKQPNAFIARDGYLHIAARKPAAGKYTSARMISKHKQAFQYGRIEARIRIPAGEGVWPAFWMLGENVDKVQWPACGELDIMENIGKEPRLVHGSVHGTGFTGLKLGLPHSLPGDKPYAEAFHNYGINWSPGRVEFYVDEPAKPYAVFTPADLPAGAKWPFDDGKYFLLLNLAIGGSWPGPPDAATKFPAEMLVEYVKVSPLPGVSGARSTAAPLAESNPMANENF